MNKNSSMYGWRCGNIKIARTNREINKEPAKMLIDIRFDKVMDWEIIEKSSKHIIVSKPLSLNLSAIDIPIKGNVNDIY